MSEMNEEQKRLQALEESTAWLKDRVWFGTGNLHDRVHHLEDRSTDRGFEVDKIKEDVKNLKTVIGLEGYGGRNLINDLRDAVDKVDGLSDSFSKLKENLITTKDFQKLLSDVDQMKQRTQVQIKFWDYVMFAIVGVVISVLTNALLARIIGAVP